MSRPEFDTSVVGVVARGALRAACSQWPEEDFKDFVARAPAREFDNYMDFFRGHADLIDLAEAIDSGDFSAELQELIVALAPIPRPIDPSVISGSDGMTDVSTITNQRDEIDVPSVPQIDPILPVDGLASDIISDLRDTGEFTASVVFGIRPGDIHAATLSVYSGPDTPIPSGSEDYGTGPKYDCLRTSNDGRSQSDRHGPAIPVMQLSGGKIPMWGAYIGNGHMITGYDPFELSDLTQRLWGYNTKSFPPHVATIVILPNGYDYRPPFACDSFHPDHGASDFGWPASYKSFIRKANDRRWKQSRDGRDHDLFCQRPTLRISNSISLFKNFIGIKLTSIYN